VSTALKVGVKVPAKLVAGADDEHSRAELARRLLERMPETDLDDDDDDEPRSPAGGATSGVRAKEAKRA
jgi:hypothetical protein